MAHRSYASLVGPCTSAETSSDGRSCEHGGRNDCCRRHTPHRRELERLKLNYRVLRRFGFSKTDEQIVESFTRGQLLACLKFNVAPREFFLTAIERGTFKVFQEPQW